MIRKVCFPKDWLHPSVIRQAIWQQTLLSIPKGSLKWDNTQEGSLRDLAKFKWLIFST